MAETLVLRLPDNESEAAHWIVVDANGARLGPPVTGPMDAAQADLADRKLTVLVPAADVLTTTVDLPLKAQAKIQQALPFALEEYLADDVEDLHFAAGVRRESGNIPVSVVNRQRFEGWLARLSESGLKADAIVAESYGLASIPGTLSVLIAGDTVIVNDGGDTELALQGVGPTDALAALGAFDQAAGDESDADSRIAESLPRHVLVYCEPGDKDRYAQEFNALRVDFDSVDIKLLPDGVLPRLAVTVGAGAGVNLLQGSYGARTEYAAMFSSLANGSPACCSCLAPRPLRRKRSTTGSSADRKTIFASVSSLRTRR